MGHRCESESKTAIKDMTDLVIRNDFPYLDFLILQPRGMIESEFKIETTNTETPLSDQTNPQEKHL